MLTGLKRCLLDRHILPDKTMHLLEAQSKEATNSWLCLNLSILCLLARPPHRLKEMVLLWLPVTVNQAIDGEAPAEGDSPIKKGEDTDTAPTS